MDGDEEVGWEAGAEGPGGLSLICLCMHHNALSCLHLRRLSILSGPSGLACHIPLSLPFHISGISVSSDYHTNGMHS